MPANRKVRTMLQILATDTKASAAIRLRCIEWIMALDGVAKPGQMTQENSIETAKLDAGLSKLIAAEFPENSAEND
jgi:hypothetical protein